MMDCLKEYKNISKELMKEIKECMYRECKECEIKQIKFECEDDIKGK